MADPELLWADPIVLNFNLQGSQRLSMERGQTVCTNEMDESLVGPG